MLKTLMGVLGLLLFLIALVLGLYLVLGNVLAVVQDDRQTAYGAIDPDAPPFCAWDVAPPERMMSEDNTQAVVVKAANPVDEPCELTISLRAPGFDMSPLKEEQEITLPPDGKGSLAWVLTPHKTGTYQIAVTDILDTRIFGITVTNVLGLNSLQVQLFSALGALFGPIFTVPWWLDKWQQRKAKQKAAAADPSKAG